MSIDAVKIPQNVHVEDRVIGPITLRQIMLTLAGGGISYGIWAAMKSAGPISPVATGIAWIPCLIFAAYAFVKINGISLTRITLLALEKFDKPNIRTWQPHKGIHINIILQGAKKRPAEHKHMQTEGRFQELSEVLDRGPEEDGAPEDGAPADVAEETTEPRAVNPNRIRAEVLRDPPVDGIGQPKPQTPERSNSGSIFRDIVPPHAV